MVRRQAALGSEIRRMYGEGKRMDIITIGKVIKVNYRYNTVDVQLKDNAVVINSGSGDGRFSAPIPVEFAGVTPDGKPFGQIQPIAVGTTVLIGFEDKHSNRPVVLAVYADPEEAYELSRAPFNSTEPNNTSVRKHMNNKFTVYPNLTYENIDGVGNRTVSFNGKSFVTFDSDGTSQASGLSDEGIGTGYENLSTSYYYSGELIEPINSKAPAILFKHQGDRNTVDGPEPDEHNFMVFLSQDGNYRTSIMRNDEDWRSYFELTPKGDFIVKYQRDTKSLKTSEDFVQFSVGDRGIEMRAGDKYFLFNEDGVSGNVGLGGGGGGGGVVEVDLSEIGEKLDDLDERIIRMGTEFTQTAEEIKQRAYLDTLLEDAIKSYQAELSIMARQIYSSVKSTEISGAVSESLQRLAEQILMIADRNEEQLATIDTIREDGSLEPLEKLVLNDIWLTIKAEYEGFLQQATETEVNTANYVSRYSALTEYLPPLLRDDKVSSQINRATFRQMFNDYFVSRVGLLQNIYDTVKSQIDIVTQKAVSAAGDTGDAFMKATLAAADALEMDRLVTILTSDNVLDSYDKQKLYGRYQNLLLAGEDAHAQAVLYGISSSDLDNATNALRDALDNVFIDMNIDTQVNSEQLRGQFANFYKACIEIYEAVTEQTQIVLDNYAGDVTDYSSKIIQTDKRISALVQSVEIQGSQVRTSRAYMELQANRFMVTISGGTYDRDLEALMATLNSGGRNLFSLTSARDGRLDDTTGKIISGSEGDKVSDFIVVPANTDFTLTIFDNPALNKLTIAYYDEYKKFISADSISDSKGEFSLTSNSPPEARYAIVSAQQLTEAKLQFEIGSTWSYYKPSAKDTVASVKIARDYRDQAQATKDAKETQYNDMNANSVEGIGTIDIIAADGTLTAVEKAQLKSLMDSIVNTHPNILSEATTYNISKTLINSHYTALKAYVDPLLSNMTQSSTVSLNSLRSFAKSYYDERLDIVSKVLTYATGAYETAEKSLREATKSANEAERLKDQLVLDAQSAARNVTTMRTLIIQERAYRDTAIPDLTSISSDGYLTDMEKVKARDYMENAKSEYNWYITQANMYDISTTQFSNAYNNLIDYVSPMITIDKLNETETVDPNTFVSTYTAYFTAKDALLNNILAGAKGILETAESQASEAMEQARLKDQEYIDYINGVNDAHEAIVEINRNIDELVNAVPYIITMELSHGSILTASNPETTATASIRRGDLDITAQIPPAYFVWTKETVDGVPDTVWNNTHVGVGRVVTIGHGEISKRDRLSVEIFEEV